MEDIYETIAGLRRRGEKTILATVVRTFGSAPRREGAKMLIHAGGRITGTVGGGALEHRVVEEALRLGEGDKPRLLHFELTNEDASQEGMVCGGSVDVFIEPLQAAQILFVFGGGHISSALVRMGKMVGFRIVVIDDRVEFANAERFPEADETMAGEIAPLLPKLNINGSSYIVIVTRGHQHDAQVLEWAVTTQAAYVGMIGSRKKVATLFSHLQSKGITQAQLDRVHAPIGLAIGAETPEEIAVSIIAEVIQIRREVNDGKANPL